MQLGSDFYRSLYEAYTQEVIHFTEEKGEGKACKKDCDECPSCEEDKTKKKGLATEPVEMESEISKAPVQEENDTEEEQGFLEKYEKHFKHALKNEGLEFCIALIKEKADEEGFDVDVDDILSYLNITVDEMVEDLGEDKEYYGNKMSFDRFRRNKRAADIQEERRQFAKTAREIALAQEENRKAEYARMEEKRKREEMRAEIIKEIEEENRELEEQTAVLEGLDAKCLPLLDALSVQEVAKIFVAFADDKGYEVSLEESIAHLEEMSDKGDTPPSKPEAKFECGEDEEVYTTSDGEGGTKKACRTKCDSDQERDKESGKCKKKPESLAAKAKDVLTKKRDLGKSPEMKAQVSTGKDTGGLPKGSNA